eukprot:g853.t1
MPLSNEAKDLGKLALSFDDGTEGRIPQIGAWMLELIVEIVELVRDLAWEACFFFFVCGAIFFAYFGTVLALERLYSLIGNPELVGLGRHLSELFDDGYPTASAALQLILALWVFNIMLWNVLRHMNHFVRGTHSLWSFLYAVLWFMALLSVPGFFLQLRVSVLSDFHKFVRLLPRLSENEKIIVVAVAFIYGVWCVVRFKMAYCIPGRDDGGSCLEFNVAYCDGSNTSGACYRSELANAKTRLEYGRDFWFGFSLRMPANYTLGQVNPQEEIHFQVHGSPNHALKEVYRNPVFALSVKPSENSSGVPSFYVKARGDPRLNISNQGHGYKYKWQNETYIGPVVGGQWENFVYHTRFVFNDTGFVKLWRNGVKVVDWPRMGTAFHDVQSEGGAPPYFKLGIYKWGWKQQQRNYDMKLSQVTYAALKVGDETSSFAEVSTEVKAVPVDTEPLLAAPKGCDVTQYGAVGDNKTEATSSFTAAIRACQGRSAVIVPAPGAYLIRPVELLSHTMLIIEPGAMLVAWGGVGWQNGWPNSTTRTCSASPYQTKRPVILPELESLLYGDAIQNVTVTGGGTIDGQGWRWWPLRDKSDYWHHCRPHLIRIHGSGGSDDLASHDIAFNNIRLYNSPRFNFHVHAARARYTRIAIVADGCPLNTDGFNVGGDEVYIADSTVHNGDDCVPLGKNTSNVVVERVTCTGCGQKHGGGASPIIW